VGVVGISRVFVSVVGWLSKLGKLITGGSQRYGAMVLKALNTVPGKSCWALNNLFILKKRVNLRNKKEFFFKNTSFWNQVLLEL
jgi:hypothetical protein